MGYRPFVLAVVLAAGAGTILPAAAPAQDPDRRTVEDVRRALMRLPYYGVFDFLAFQYEKGTVTLSGYTVRPVLKSEAVRALKRVARVDQVIDTVEELPVSNHDEQLRWATFNAIYDDVFLARYVPGGTLVRFDRYFSMARFPGMQPFGTYPVHIIVRGGRTLLVGAVDFAQDKQLAEVRAREVPGAFAVESDIMVLGGR
jgi:hyperosmotically inducible periplasmic protein